jgi:hypothetical protein
MEDRERALEIANRFIELEDENRVLREILRRYWTHETPAEDFVQKGIQQIQAREKEALGSQRLESLFHSAIDDGVLMRTLHDKLLRKAKI